MRKGPRETCVTLTFGRRGRLSRRRGPAMTAMASDMIPQISGLSRESLNRNRLSPTLWTSIADFLERVDDLSLPGQEGPCAAVAFVEVGGQAH